MPRPSRLLTAALPLALLASTATARRPHTPHTLKLRFPRLSIPAKTNPEACVLVRVATTAPFDLASIEIRHRGVRGSFAVQHFLVHLYTGERLGEFGAERGRVVPSRGCLDLGPSDRDRRQLVASGTLTRSRSAFPPGVALRLSPVPDTPAGERHVAHAERARGLRDDAAVEHDPQPAAAPLHARGARIVPHRLLAGARLDAARGGRHAS